MGQLEKEIRKTEVQQTILSCVATAGVIGIALLAPNALQMLKIFDKDTGKRKTHSINVSRERLIKKGLIKNRNGFLELTGKGERVLESIENRHYKIKKPRRWDQKWRIIIFDIPTCKNKLRDQTRLTLKAVGFVKLQDSVWVYPYNCEDLINLIKADFKIGKDLLYIVADKIENDLKLRKHFELK